jgi:hypothetical protein
MGFGAVRISRINRELLLFGGALGEIDAIVVGHYRASCC